MFGYRQNDVKGIHYNLIKKMSGKSVIFPGAVPFVQPDTCVTRHLCNPKPLSPIIPERCVLCL